MAESVSGVPTSRSQTNIGTPTKNYGAHGMWQVIRDLHIAGYSSDEINYWLWSIDENEKGPTSVTWYYY